MGTKFRKALHGCLPSHFVDPFGLTGRLLASKSSAAYFAMLSSLGRIACLPADLLLSGREQALYHAATEAKLPIIFIVGPPRSGTTLVAQTLIRHLPVAYINNLTALFPRSPISINSFFDRPLRNERQGDRSYFGKTAGFWGQNDALHIWDRWLGTDRTTFPAELNEDRRQKMKAFFGAYETFSGRPLIAKNNNMNAFAHLIADALPTATFICLQRSPRALAQSLLISRQQIQGSSKHRYGLVDPERKEQPVDDAIADVCRQIRYFRDLEETQRARIGAERFWTLSYEAFCQNPSALVAKVADEILRMACPDGQPSSIKPFNISKTDKLNPTDLAHLEAQLRLCGLGQHMEDSQEYMEARTYRRTSSNI